MKVIIPVLASVLILASCDQLKNKADELKDTPISFSIPGNDIHENLDTMGVTGTVTLGQDSSFIDIQKALTDQGVSSDKLKSITLKTITIKIDSGMSNFDFLSAVTAKIGTPKIAKVNLGELNPVPDGLNKIILQCNFDMKPYINEKYFDFSFTLTSDKAVTKRTFFIVSYAYDVEASILK